MNQLFSTIALPLVYASLMLAGVDGKWSFETRTEGKKRAGTTVTTVLDLKVDGDKLTGSVTGKAGKRGRALELKDGKVDGNTITFTTVQQSKKGEISIQWKGTLEGEQLKLSRSVRSGKRSQEFVAKRQ